MTCDVSGVGWAKGSVEEGGGGKGWGGGASRKETLPNLERIF